MSNNRAIRWLLSELPGLVKSDVLTDDEAGRLKTHYGPMIESGRNVALLVSSVIGSVLVGAGIILLFAHNWSGLSRWLRTVLAVGPLVAAQAVGVWGICRCKGSTAWRESIAAMIFLLIASSIALVGQTYHIPGDLGSFLIVWMLLALPLVYVLDVSLVCVCYLVGITSWAGYAQETGGHAVLFWLLFLLALPHVWMVYRRDRESPRVALEGWAIAVCLVSAVGVTMEKCLPGLWIIDRSGMFSVFYLVGTYWFRRS
ncbi:MAG: DUF2157 domain-containing protein, partial [Candidatus Pacebacteria bacterium]|nr:DUF2157 domain-containing protein [Candidatus Paceibacterota bacterium]